MEIEIWSDIACPWCYVGKRRFEAALDRFEHRDDVHVTWRSFELDPSAPSEREGERAARLAEKYGMTRRARPRDGAADGRRRPRARGWTSASTSSDPAPRSTAIASSISPLSTALSDAMKERLLRAYFTEGELMGDAETLIRLAGEVGLDPDETRQMLASDRYADDVRDDERTASQLRDQRGADVRDRPHDRRVRRASARRFAPAPERGLVPARAGAGDRRRRGLRA